MGGGPAGGGAAGAGGGEALLVLGGLALLGTIGGMLWLNRLAGKPSKGEVVGRVQAIYVYPLKSGRGIPLEASLVEARGLVFDRLWMVATAEGRFRTQRQLPKMALIQPRLPGGMTEPLVLSAPGMPTISVPVTMDGKSMQVGVWGDTVRAFDQGDAAALWISTYLEEEGLRLVRIDEAERRQVDPDYAIKGQTTAFADGFPLLLANQSSLDDLNTRLAAPIPMNRFRPNIIVEGPPAWSEDGWHRIAIGGLRLRVVKPCSRCKMPNIDQATSEVDMVVTEALKTFRTGEKLGIGIGGKTEVYFGQNVVNDKRTGMLRVGDAVTVFT